MTPTEKGRRVDALNQGPDTRRVLCEMVTNRESDLEDARAESARLREDLKFERSENGWAREFLNRMGQKCGTKDCPSLVAYVTKLEAENAKLRDERREYQATIDSLVDECADHKSENDRLRQQLADATESMGRVEMRCAKLRELVKRMFDRVNYECRCCSVFCSDWDEDNECCVFTTLMRELGMEVD